MLENRPSRAFDLHRPPDDLPADPARFFRAAPPPPSPASSTHPHHNHHAPNDHAEPPPSALDRLGASPLPKTGFPFIGFLSGVYEHVAQVARGEAPANET